MTEEPTEDGPEDLGEPEAMPAPADDSDVPWRRLNSRVIWVDVLQVFVSLIPAAVAVVVFGVKPGEGLWPALAIAAFGIVGAAGDAIRWFFTWYRITDDYVERRTGVFVRQYRSIRRERIRSVDTEAKLRHRIASLRVVRVSAAQQSAARGSSLSLDAVLKEHATELQHDLLPGRTSRRAESAAGEESDPDATEPSERLAGFDPRWVAFNIFSVWAFLMALGLLWGAFWLLGGFGLDPVGFVKGVVDWDGIGWAWSAALVVIVVGAIGAVGMAGNFFTEYWGHRLTRVRGEDGSRLVTTRGLFRTREINRDVARIRGVQISEPVFWRWIGMADTSLISTGLDMWAMSQPASILPRGPISVARRVAAAIIGAEPDPFSVELRPHPRRALRRRLVWAAAVTAIVLAALAWGVATTGLTVTALLVGVPLLALALGAALVAFRALGHRIAGEHLVVRSGLMSRATTVLRRDAVSTIAVRESLLQRRLRLMTVSTMTAAGYGVYEAPDLDREDALEFAAEAAPGLLGPFLEPVPNGESGEVGEGGKGGEGADQTADAG